ncbi:hypothetical protein [Thiocapsa sp. N5-Cardenillas]|uniref:hypothetical protein n=1 Tax=Thiocapsa sp. N5-Cardenillas TaxID=3137397 RepID=UPI0035AEBC1A
MTIQPKSQYAELFGNMDQQLEAVLRRITRAAELAKSLEDKLSSADLDTDCDDVRQDYLDRLESLDLRVTYLEKRLKSIGIHPDEPLSYPDTLDILAKLDRLPL